MATVHRSASVDVLDRLLDGPDRSAWLDAVYETMRNLKKGFYEDADYIVQSHWSSGVDIYEAFSFAWVRSQVVLGRAWMCDIPIGCTPGADADIEGNNQKLLHELPFVYPLDGNKNFRVHAEFVPDSGGGANDDGLFEFNDTRFQRFGDGFVLLETKLFSGVVPLEVGLTRASKTAMHIAQGGVARWPYGSETIRLFYVPFYSYVPDISR